MINTMDVRDFGKKFACDVSAVPGNLVLIGCADDGSWASAPDRNFSTPASDRVRATIRLFGRHVRPSLPNRPFWFLLCFWDGWCERHVFADRYTWVSPGNLDASVEWRGAPGELPILSATRRWIACYCAHRGDPSAVLLPDPHYLWRAGYATTLQTLRNQHLPWEEKVSRAVFCGSDHGDVANYFPPLVPDRPHARRYLKHVVDAQKLDVDVHLGQGVSLAQQISCKWVLDVDGFTRTWDAFAWKMQSGSVMLSVASPWESFFTRQFEPWIHYVPIANDFSDLGERLHWCRTHDDECRDIAQRARRHAEAVYRPEHVARTVVRQWQTLLGEADAAVAVHHVER